MPHTLRAALEALSKPAVLPVGDVRRFLSENEQASTATTNQANAQGVRA